MPFVKLDCGILNSTLWFERTAREIFITALLMAEPFETPDPLPQICTNSLELTGWFVPPGWYGFIQAAGVGIIHRAQLELNDDTRAALASLGEPELTSRSQDFEGRRLVRVNGGFIALNFIKFRDKDATTADRSRRWRERQKQKQATRVSNTSTRSVRHAGDTIAEAEAEAIQQQALVVTGGVFAPNGPAPVFGHSNPHKNHACCGKVCLHSSQFEQFTQLAGSHPDPDRYVRDFFGTWNDRYVKGDRSAEIIGEDGFDFWRARWAETHPSARGRQKADAAEATKAHERQQAEIARGAARRKGIGL